jgi:hypothetical protein
MSRKGEHKTRKTPKSQKPQGYLAEQEKLCQQLKAEADAKQLNYQRQLQSLVEDNA